VTIHELFARAIKLSQSSQIKANQDIFLPVAILFLQAGRGLDTHNTIITAPAPIEVVCMGTTVAAFASLGAKIE
jgi:hypothetical protein